MQLGEAPTYWKLYSRLYAQNVIRRGPYIISLFWESHNKLMHLGEIPVSLGIVQNEDLNCLLVC